jgi:hypothetical protein
LPLLASLIIAGDAGSTSIAVTSIVVMYIMVTSIGSVSASRHTIPHMNN